MGRIRPTLIRPVMIVGGIGGVALGLALLMLAVTSWRALDLAEPVRQHVQRLESLRELTRLTQQLLFRDLSKEAPPSERDVDEVRTKVTRLIETDADLDRETRAGLVNARGALAAFSATPQAALLGALGQIRKALDHEARVQLGLIEEMHAYALTEYRISVAAFLGLPLFAMLAFLSFRGHILGSIDRVTALLERLAEQHFVPAPVSATDRDLKPVLESYNNLVARLAAAEVENARRQKDLEAQVRAATHTVLGQGRALAEADRLTAVGETSARLAHELRNPLAGIELGLSNLRVDCEATGACPDLCERLGPMISELQRMSRLLTELLEQGRRLPEPATVIDLAQNLGETVQLARYQTPENISIDARVADGLACLLPRDTLRQVVFNLILNSVQVIGDKPGLVEVSAERVADEIKIVVADSGPGFPADILTTGPRMFLTRRRGGTGLGLATVRRLIDGMGGRVQFANRAEGGAVVTLFLPCGSGHA